MIRDVVKSIVPTSVRIVSHIVVLEIETAGVLRRKEYSLIRTPLQETPFRKGDIVSLVDVTGLAMELHSRFTIHEVLPDGQVRAEDWKGAILPHHIRHVESEELEDE